MPTLLKDLTISEVSVVDEGACRDGDTPLATAVLVKRDYSQDQRDQMAGKEAMPDGSFPIKDEADLKNAIQAFGRAKNRGVVKAHIIRRAKVLGLSKLIPETWNVKKMDNDEAKGLLARLGAALGLTAYGATDDDGEAEDPADSDMQGVTFDQAYAAIEAREYAADILSEVQEASEALYRSIHSILDDETVSDPEGAVRATMDQFKEHMANLVPEEMEKAFAKVGKALTAGSAGTPQTVNKGDSAVTEDLTKALADKDAEIVKLKADLDEAKKPKMTTAEEEAEKCAKALEALPESVRKQLAEGEDLKKRLAALEADREFESFKKRAADCGLAETAAKHLQVIGKASPEALDFVEKLAKAAQEVEKRSDLFKELGTGNGADVSSAEAQLTTKAHEIAKAENITFAKAFTKACDVHNDLYRAYRAERG